MQPLNFKQAAFVIQYKRTNHAIEAGRLVGYTKDEVVKQLCRFNVMEHVTRMWEEKWYERNLIQR